MTYPTEKQLEELERKLTDWRDIAIGALGFVVLAIITGVVV